MLRISQVVPLLSLSQKTPPKCSILLQKRSKMPLKPIKLKKIAFFSKKNSKILAGMEFNRTFALFNEKHDSFIQTVW
jgi:hypothetical protein